MDLHKTAAQSYQDMYSADHSRSDMLENAIQEYIKALSINSKDYDSNINLAINYYNLGVQEISEINHNTPIQELIMIQEECVGYFKKSLPYMLEAHSQTKERVEPLKGLMAIYKALNDDEKSDDYKEKLSQVIQEE